MPEVAEKPLTGTKERVETFEKGTYAKRRPTDIGTFTDEHLDTIERNFQALSSGERPLHSVPVVLTHDGTFAYGWVTKTRRNPKTGILETDWRDVAPELERAIDEGKVERVSAEIEEGFTDQSGKTYDGPYLSRVAVIGAHIPRVKGMTPIPKNQFSESRTPLVVERPFRVAEFTEPVMDIAAAAAYFASQGIDTTGWETYPPECQAALIAVATWAQDPGTGDPTLMSEPATPAPKKVVTTQHFAERDIGRRVNSAVQAAVGRVLTPALKQIQGAQAAAVKAQEEYETEKRLAGVMEFCERHKGVRLSPADLDQGSQLSEISVGLDLARIAPPAEPMKFADGKPALTPLEKWKANIEARKPMEFSERVQQPANGNGNLFDALRKKTEAKYAPKADAIPLEDRLHLRRPAGLR